MVRDGGGESCFYRPEPGGLTQDWESQQNALAEWIGSLPRPLGLIACNDIHGLRALDACRRAQLAVPEEVAVIGADNDAELCDLSDPPLTSIEFNRERAGYEAAALLDCLMMGDAPSSAAILIPPRGVITRQSTDILAISDRYVAQAVHVIRRRACSGIDVQSVLEELPLSRRSLEERFRRISGPLAGGRDPAGPNRTGQDTSGRDRPDRRGHQPSDRIQQARLFQHRFQKRNRERTVDVPPTGGLTWVIFRRRERPVRPSFPPVPHPPVQTRHAGSANSREHKR